jgi:hypothetical protein
MTLHRSDEDTSHDMTTGIKWMVYATAGPTHVMRVDRLPPQENPLQAEVERLEGRVKQLGEAIADHWGTVDEFGDVVCWFCKAWSYTNELVGHEKWCIVLTIKEQPTHER